MEMGKFDSSISRTKTFFCITCGKEAPARYSGKNMYCSYACNPICRKGRIFSEETKRRMSEGSKGKHKNPKTEFKKGDRVPYSEVFENYKSLHSWVSYNKDKRGQCRVCNKVTNLTDWANISWKYKKDLNDYIELCKKCHSDYDHGKISLKGII